MYYRIVTDGYKYEIEYRYFWFPFWIRLKPKINPFFFQPIDWSKYRFYTKDKAQKRIKELKESYKKKWKVVHD